MITIGLFGTCGSSKWREPFINEYEKNGIDFFNPQVAEGTWSPGMVADENKHLIEDDIILFPVTSETTGQGSLAEIGFSIASALRANKHRYFIFMIDDLCNDPSASVAQIVESNRSRKLVKSKLQEIANNNNIFLVDDLENMLEISKWLHKSCVYHSAAVKKIKRAA